MRGVGQSQALAPALPAGASRPGIDDLRLGLRRIRGSTRTGGWMRGVGQSRALAPALPAGASRPATDDLRVRLGRISGSTPTDGWEGGMYNGLRASPERTERRPERARGALNAPGASQGRTERARSEPRAHQAAVRECYRSISTRLERALGVIYRL